MVAAFAAKHSFLISADEQLLQNLIMDKNNK